MDELMVLMGTKGISAFIGLLIFLVTLKYSKELFDWVETNTYGLKDFIMDRLDFLHIKVEENKIIFFLLLMSLGSGILIFSICAFFGKYVLGAIFGALFTFIGWKIPKPLIHYLVNKRIKAYSGQLVDGLNLLSNGLRAGLSLPQSLAMVVAELPPPISQEYNIILAQNRIGQPLEECFEDLAKRLPTEDTQMFVTSINILRETGGNLAETFDSITEVIRERIRLKQKIETLVAQGMMQGYVLFATPFAMLVMFYLNDPETMQLLFTHPIGIVALIVAIGMDCLGLFVIFKIINIKV